MSFVDFVVHRRAKFKNKGSVLKLLNTPIGWDLKDRGGFLEKFVHESGWLFYTGFNIVTLRNDEYEFDIGGITHLWFTITKKEEKFVKAWLKFNKEKLGE